MNLSYEHQFQVLAAKIASIAKGNLPLEQAFSEYEQSLTLLQACQEYLSEVETKISSLPPSEISSEAPLEELLDELELSVQIFEQTETLEEAVEYYAMGMDLILQSQKMLEKYEQDVFTLSKQHNLITESTVAQGNNNV
jgi:exodeoxyribonuclease VII small subunit